MVLDLQEIEEFYADRVIFITGATGFLGRIALEKLLRACPKIKKIYILLRGKKAKDCAKRFEEIFDGVVFENLAKQNPNYRQKVQMIVGDCCLPDLALRPEMRALIVSEVDVIIHWAATVKFDENLKVATNINVRALRDLIRMAREMPQLKSFLHVSTAFSNCIRQDIDEIFYDTPISGTGLINMMEALDSKLVADITPSVLGKWPNSYVFTKAVAENLLRDEGRGLPIGMIRPSIVLASYREPVPGWIDNVYGATGILVGSALGLLRILHTDLSCTAEMMPADYVVNTALVAIVDIHHQHKKSLGLKNPNLMKAEEAIPIYNAVSSTLKCIDWRQFMKLSQKHCLEVPSPKVLWHSQTIYTANYYVYKIGAFFLHTIPAHLIDLTASILGKKPMMVKGYEKIHKFTQVIAYFSTRTWKFHNTNVQKLFLKLKIKDRAKFDFNIAIFDWDAYFYHYIRGGRAYILKDTLDTVPQGKRKLFILRIAHYALCCLLLYGVYKLCCLIFTY